MTMPTYVDPMDRNMMTARLGGRDPDAALVALFRHHAIPNEAATAKAGRPIFDDMEVCEIRFPGSRAVSVFPATAQSDWVTDPYTGGSTPRTYAERFAREYQQFKRHVAQTKAGTPLQYVPFLTEGRRAELQALNIYTIEALAIIDGQELKNLGPGGRELKNQAEAFLADAGKLAPSTQLQAELEATKARVLTLEEDNKALQAQAAQGRGLRRCRARQHERRAAERLHRQQHWQQAGRQFGTQDVAAHGARCPARKGGMTMSVGTILLIILVIILLGGLFPHRRRAVLRHRLLRRRRASAWCSWSSSSWCCSAISEHCSQSRDRLH